MDPNHPSNTPAVPSHVTPPNQSILHVNQNPFNPIYSQPTDQFQHRPQFLPLPQPQPQPQQQTSPSQLALVPTSALPTIIDPSYRNMICDAIRDLNKPNGSTKLAISRHMRRSNALLPSCHGASLTYHLRTLRNSGVVTLVKRSYKLASAPLPPPQHLAIAAPDLVAPPMDTSPLDLLAETATGLSSASQPQKRGRGRPPKATPEPMALVPYGQSSRQQQPELPVTSPTQVVVEPKKRGRGRPRKNGSVPNAPTAGPVLALPAPIVATSTQQGMRRGPGRPPKITRNRPRKSDTPTSIRTVTGTLEPAFGELKRKFDFAREKAKKISKLLEAGIGMDDVQVRAIMSQARQDTEGLISILTVEPYGVGQVQPHTVEVVQARAVEEVQPEEAMEEDQI